MGLNCYPSLDSTNIYLPALEILKFYARRWKIEQMIKDLKQRLGFGDYQLRNLPGIHRHMAITLLSYFVLIMLKILQNLKNPTVSPHLSIRVLAALVRRNILAENITITLTTMRVRFKQIFWTVILNRLRPESARLQLIRLAIWREIFGSAPGHGISANLGYFSSIPPFAKGGQGGFLLIGSL